MRVAPTRLIGALFAIMLLIGTGASPAIAQPAPSIDVDISGPRQGTAGDPLTFMGSIKPAAGNPIDVVFAWDFGDGTGATGASAVHSYAAAGSYRLTCTASSAANLSTSNAEQRTMTIAAAQPAEPAGAASGPRPHIEIQSMGPRRGIAGTPTQFHVVAAATGLSPEDLLYAWDFGDGADATGQAPTHVYVGHGIYSVTATVSSATHPAVADDYDLAVAVSDSSVGIVTFSLDDTAPPNTFVTYPAGWNLVAGPEGTRFTEAAGPLYTLSESGDSYIAVPADAGIDAGRGYWAFFSRATTKSLAGAAYGDNYLLAERGSYAMAGNPAPAHPVTVHGAEAAYAWNPQTGTYASITTLLPGQGAWVIAANAATAP